jgi:fibronectin-binding autotransporter adhesin
MPGPTAPATALWSNPSNWTGGVLPQNGDYVARFSGTGGSVTLDASASVEEVDFGGSGTGRYALAASAGKTLTLSSANGPASQCLINVLSGSHEIFTPLSLAAAGNLFTVTGTADSLTVSGNISGTGNITKTGFGTLVLSGSDTYGGATAISQGKLVVSGALGSTVVSVNAGAKLDGTGSLW